MHDCRHQPLGILVVCMVYIVCCRMFIINSKQYRAGTGLVGRHVIGVLSNGPRQHWPFLPCCDPGAARCPKKVLFLCFEPESKLCLYVYTWRSRANKGRCSCNFAQHLPFKMNSASVHPLRRTKHVRPKHTANWAQMLREHSCSQQYC